MSVDDIRERAEATIRMHVPVRAPLVWERRLRCVPWLVRRVVCCRIDGEVWPCDAVFHAERQASTTRSWLARLDQDVRPFGGAR